MHTDQSDSFTVQRVHTTASVYSMLVKSSISMSLKSSPADAEVIPVGVDDVAGTVDLLGGYGVLSSRRASTTKHGSQRFSASAKGFSSKSTGHISPQLLLFRSSRHCSKARTAQVVAFSVFAGTKPLQISSILSGNTEEA